MSDAGTPFVLSLPESIPIVSTYADIAHKLTDEVHKLREQASVDVKYDPQESKVIVNFGDGTSKRIDPFELRTKCMCAACIDEIDGRQIL